MYKKYPVLDAIWFSVYYKVLDQYQLHTNLAISMCWNGKNGC
eukprot:SAG11_NODE_39682_length_224_cov_223.896000_1_plen_41_part_10